MSDRNIYRNKIGIVFLATICCFLWGSAYPSIKIGYSLLNIASDDISGKLLFAGYRFALAGLIVLIFLVISKENIFKLSKKGLFEISCLGIIQTTLQYIFFYVGLAYTTGVRGAILNGTGTFFSIILAHFVYKNDKINFNKILGCIIGFIGVIIVNFNGGSIIGYGGFSIKGEGFVVLAALMLSISSIYSKKITKNLNPSVVTGYQLLIGGIILIVLGYCCGGKLSGFSIASVLLLLYMALLSSVAFVIWSKLLKYNKVSSISVFNFLIPIFGAFLSAIFLGENIFDIKVFISLLLVSLGIYSIYWNKEKI